MSKRVRSTDFASFPARKRRGGPEPEGWRALLSLRRGDLRISPHLYNTSHDIDRALEVLENAG